MTKNTLLLFLTLIIHSLSFSQEVPFCDSHGLTNESLNSHPKAKEAFEQREVEFQNFIAQKSMLKLAAAAHPKRVIPVVFHIIHDYNSNYISDAQIESAMENINLDYQKLNPDTIDVVSAFESIIGDANLTFKLAQLDPNGNCTKGVTRTFSRLTNFAGENVKDLIKWDPSMYLNVWIVEKIGRGSGGYSYLPGSAPPYSNTPPYATDGNAGIVVINSQFGATGTSNGSQFSRHTLSHEIGHYLGLAHTWGSTNTPNNPNNCSQDDGISDTPECIGQSFNCDLTIQTCGSLDNVQNIMCYAGCPSMFTVGQTDRLHFNLNNHTTGLAPRRELWQQSNLIATGTNDTYTPQNCLPIADAYIPYTNICVDEAATIKAYSYNSTDPVTYSWNLVGAQNPNQTGDEATLYYSTPGQYTVELTATNSAGNHVVVKTQYITVRNSYVPETIPFYQGFESSITLNSALEGKSWLTESDNADQWTLNSHAGFNSSKSMRATTKDFEELVPGKITLTMPYIDLTDAVSGIRLYFRHAYRNRMDNSNDKLAVYISKNCGESWSRRKNIQPNNLITRDQSKSLNWTPNDEDWVENSISLNTGKGISNFLIKFELEGSEGAYLYIDSVEIHSYPLSQDEIELNSNALDIYPNPIEDNSVIAINNIEGKDYEVSIRNLLGQTIESWSGNSTSDQTLIETPKYLTTGIYLVQLNVNGKQTVKKIIVN